MINALAGFALGGLSTMEMLALAVAYVAVMAFLWMTGMGQPERLLTEAGFRATWAIVALALIRPVTWIPYVLPFLAFRKVTDELIKAWRPIVRSGVAHLLTIGVLAGAVWLLELVAPGAVSAILSGLAFATGSGSLSTLGHFTGHWTAGRVAGLAAIVLVVRVLVPPLRRDLDPFPEPVLWFPDGARGRFDRVVLLVVLGGSALLLLAGAVVARLG